MFGLQCMMMMISACASSGQGLRYSVLKATLRSSGESLNKLLQESIDLDILARQKVCLGRSAISLALLEPLLWLVSELLLHLISMLDHSYYVVEITFSNLRRYSCVGMQIANE